MTDTERDIVDQLADVIWSQHPLCKGRRPKWAEKAAEHSWKYIVMRLQAEADREAADEMQIRSFQG